MVRRGSPSGDCCAAVSLSPVSHQEVRDRLLDTSPVQSSTPLLLWVPFHLAQSTPHTQPQGGREAAAGFQQLLSPHPLPLHARTRPVLKA